MLGFLRPWLPDHHTSLEALYVTEALRNFGISLVGIFVPVYIYQLTGNFFWLPAYLFILSIPVLLFTIPVSSYLRKIGIARSIFISNLLRLAVFGLLLFAPSFHPAIFVAAFFDGLLIPFYWVPYHFIYTRRGRIGGFGKQIGFMGIVTTLSSFPAPLLGGLVISQFGFPMLYLIGMTIILFSSLPVAWVGDHLEVDEISPREIIGEVFAGKNRNFLLGLAGVKLDGVLYSFLLWPVFLFTLSHSFPTLGGISSATSLVWILAAVPISALVDRLGPRRCLWIGAISAALFWAFVGFFTSVPIVFGLTLVMIALGPFMSITPDSVVYTLAQSRKTLEFIIERELWLNFGGWVASGVTALLWFFFPQNWPVLFLPGVIGALATVLITYSSKSEKVITPVIKGELSVHPARSKN